MVVVNSIDRCGKYISCAEDVLAKTFFPAGIHFSVVQDDFCSIEKSREEIDEYFRKEKIAVQIKSIEIYYIWRFTYIKQYHIKDVVNIVAILSGISAILVGVASIRISNLGAVKEYFQQGDNKEYTTARHNLYKKFEEGVSIDPNDADASNTVSFFHFWGLMVKKKYLPFWVFKSACEMFFPNSRRLSNSIRSAGGQCCLF